jgi:hypothetical protein
MWPVWVCLAFSLATLNDWFSYNTFLDGLTYGTVALNWAEGLGSSWKLFYTSSLYPEFYEHPPLFFWLEGSMFRLFGDQVWIEELFMSSVLLLTLVFISRPFDRREDEHMPLFEVVGFILLPGVAWSYDNNMLEPVLALFFISSIFFFNSIHNSTTEAMRNAFAALSGLSVTGAILVKGAVALPIIFFPFVLIIQRKVAHRYLALYLSMILMAVIFFVLHDPSREFWLAYWNKQVLGSSGMGMTDLRGGLSRLTKVLSAPGLMLLMVLLLIRFDWVDFKRDKLKSYWVIWLALSLPWLFFAKFNPHYLFPGTVVLWYGMVRSVEWKKSFEFKWVPALVLFIGLLLGLVKSPSSRNVFDLLPYLEESTSELRVSRDLCDDWYLHAAVMRVKRRSLLCVGKDAELGLSAQELNCDRTKIVGEYIFCDE